MRPLSLRLKGFKGIRAGLGLEEIALDLSDLRGTVALIGENGRGKSTLLDNLHPYRIMPYKCRKARDYSPGSFSFYDHTFGEAAKELLFEVAGQVYRSLVLIDADRRKQEAYLYRREVNGCVSWAPTNDGKVKTYDEAVEKLCGSPSLFFTSVFRAQGAKNLSDYSRGDVMALVGELLGVDHVRAQSEKAREVAKILGEHVNADRRRVADLLVELATDDELAEGERSVRAELEAASTFRDTLRDFVKQASDTVADAELQEAAREADRLRLASLEAAWKAVDATLEDLSVQRRRLDAARDLALQKAGTRRAAEEGLLGAERETIAAEERKAKSTHAARTGPIRTRLERAKKVLANADAIRAKVEEEAEAKTKLARLDEEQGTLQETIRGLTATAERFSVIRQGRQEHQRLLDKGKAAREHAMDRVRAEITRAEAAAQRLDGLDCAARGDGWVNETCALLKDAVAAKHTLPDLLEKLDRLSEPTAEEQEHAGTIERLSAEAEALAFAPEALQAKQEALRGVHEEAVAARKALESLGRWTATLPELEHAEATIQEGEAEMSRADGDLADALRSLADRTLAVDRREQEAGAAYQNEVEEADKAYRHEAAALQTRWSQVRSERIAKHQEWSDLADRLRGPFGNLEDLRRAVRDRQTALDRAEEGIRELHGQLGGIEARRKTLAQKREAAEQLQERIGRFDVEIARWKRLERAFGNDGVIALEIDDSGAGISAIANQLLADCFGARFSLRFETQREKLKGGAAETFDVTVFDAETGEASSITEKSGGQMVWLESALTRAIALFNAEGSGHDFQAFYGDEADGPLDPQKKAAYMAVKRRALEIGRHTVEYFVSQDAGIQEMADRQIILGDGGVRIA